MLKVEVNTIQVCLNFEMLSKEFNDKSTIQEDFYLHVL